MSLNLGSVPGFHGSPELPGVQGTEHRLQVPGVGCAGGLAVGCPALPPAPGAPASPQGTECHSRPLEPNFLQVLWDGSVPALL